MKKLLLLGSAILLVAAVVWAAAPTTLEDFHLAGTQPNQVTLEGPNRCHNCHGGYDAEVEPSTGWKGTMMAQAMRDPLFRAFVVIANQDAPESGDLCIRCHTPEGWLEGRSTPTDGSSLTTRDFEGITCDFCHKLVKPAALGENPYPGDADYLNGAYDADQADLASLADIPPQSGNGMYIVSSNKAKRGPFVDASARHQMFYSPFHQEAALCGTCHDVSNPVFSRTPDNTYVPNDFDVRTDSYNTYEMYPVERTYSEWLMSDYNTEAGVYAPEFGGNKDNVSTCQDCHMRDVTGVGCNKKGTQVRDDLPLHDLTGGNTFVPGLIAQLFPDEVDIIALQAGVERATRMLQMAATMDVNYTVTGSDIQLDVKIINETGHKLPSGYPEGRRIWINIQSYDATDNLLYESGAYDINTGILTHDIDVKIYEIKPGIDSLLGSILGKPAEPTFHFVLNNTVYKDNRIPARGFTNANYEQIQSPVIGYSYPDGQYWDNTLYSLPLNSSRVEITMYYQTTSKELIEFLRDENVTDDAGQIMYDLWDTNGKSAPVAMNTATLNISQPVPPTAEFAGTPTNGSAPLTVAFVDQSSNQPTSWLWDFGDGNSSNLQNPSHTYANTGVYTVSFTVTNSYGSDSNSKIDYITVNEVQMTYMHVADISVTRSGKKQITGIASVTLLDASSAPVSGAVVTGDFSGPTSGTFSTTTDANGIATLSSNRVRNPVGEFCFTVIDVTKTDAVYDSNADIVLAACESGIVASTFELSQNYPNPFNPTTSISFSLKQSSTVKLTVYNVAGQKVTVLVDEQLASGSYSYKWDGSGLASGVYLYRLETSSGSLTKKMILTK